MVTFIVSQFIISVNQINKSHREPQPILPFNHSNISIKSNTKGSILKYILNILRFENHCCPF